MRTASLFDAARTGLPRGQVRAALRSILNIESPDLVPSRDADGPDQASRVNNYYDLVTDFYEYGWGRCFHFAPRYQGESRRESLLRHEYRLAANLGLRPGMRVLDVGCGVGGPMQNIARFAGVDITGINSNAYQIRRARQHVGDAGLRRRLEFVQADFARIPLDDGDYDAAYAIEATCHAADRTAVFAEVLRILKPGGWFGGYEWCLTERFDPGDARHLEVKRGIEEGDALPGLTGTGAVDRALERAGFELHAGEDLAPESDPATPWYLPLTGREWTLQDIPRTVPGRVLGHGLVRLLETLRLAPAGASGVSRLLNRAAKSLVAGGEMGIFTPMYFFLARKPGR